MEHLTRFPYDTECLSHSTLAADLENNYLRHGFVVLDRCFSREEVRAMCTEIEILKQQDMPGRILETDQHTVRALHGCHLHSSLFARVILARQLLQVARSLLGEDVYVYQFKVNLKARFSGDIWPWHQDFIYWHREDGTPHPHLVTFALFLDDVTEFNGAMMLIPNSQNHGLIEVENLSTAAGDLMGSLGAQLKYQLTPSTIDKLVAEGGLVAPKAAAGSVLIFHPNIAHASPPNLSPFDRKIAFITYNRTTNAPPPSGTNRPAWLVGRDTSPLLPLDGPLV